MKNSSFYSKGKFLISGEYLVLKGAKALALPLKFGQELIVYSSPDSDLQLSWEAYVNDEFWFGAILDIESLEVIETSDLSKARILSKIITQANILNPKILQSSKGLTVRTNANFDMNWGLGSSSTLIANVAKWFQVDPFKLHFATSSGSGYDVACANADNPIFYTLKGENPLIEKANFYPDFSDQLYFVYLGNKQLSNQSINNFADSLKNREKEIERVSVISEELTATHDLDEFEFFINELEQTMSGILNEPTAKEKVFPDFPGSVKSLGAWGGDFVMISWREDFGKLKHYLKTKNLYVVFRYDELVLNIE